MRIFFEGFRSIISQLITFIQFPLFLISSFPLPSSFIFSLSLSLPLSLFYSFILITLVSQSFQKSHISLHQRCFRFNFSFKDFGLQIPSFETKLSNLNQLWLILQPLHDARFISFTLSLFHVQQCFLSFFEKLKTFFENKHLFDFWRRTMKKKKSRRYELRRSVWKIESQERKEGKGDYVKVNIFHINLIKISGRFLNNQQLFIIVKDFMLSLRGMCLGNQNSNNFWDYQRDFEQCTRNHDIIPCKLRLRLLNIFNGQFNHTKIADFCFCSFDVGFKSEPHSVQIFWAIYIE